MNFWNGWKTNLMAVLTAVLPLLSDAVASFVAANPGLTGAVVGAVFFFLRQITKTPSALLPK